MTRFSRMALPSLIALALVLGALPVAQAETHSYTIDPVHSAFLFRVKHANVGYTYGRFNEFGGTIVVDDENPANSRVEITVQVKSVDTANEKRDQHLRSPDFFNVNQFPTMTFKSTAVKKTEDGAYEVTGDFTLHGTTKPLTVLMTKTGEGSFMGNYLIGFEGAATLQRSEFGMDKMLNVVSDKIWITIAVEAQRS